MPTAKPFLTYQQQLDKLEQEKGLLIPDHDKAETILKRVSYFALIGGYKEPFKNPTTGKFRDEATFDEIVALYHFDEDLRELFLRYMLRIERNIRSLLSYYFVARFGENQSAYLSAANYSKNPKHTKEVAKLLQKLSQTAISSNDYPYINHQRTQYGNVPLWVLVNVLTFGTLSKMYMYIPQAQQIEISKNFAHVSEKELRQYLSVLTKFRNVCAHNERLYSYKTRNSIPDTPLHTKLAIPKRGTEYAMGKNDLFAVVIAFRYLLPADEFSVFKRRLAKLIDKLFSRLTHISQEELFRFMGFPTNWKRITAFKL